jgi:hypothetical protein
MVLELNLLDIPGCWILYTILFEILGFTCVALAGWKLYFFLKYSERIISLASVVLTLEILTNIGKYKIYCNMQYIVL